MEVRIPQTPMLGVQQYISKQSSAPWDNNNGNLDQAEFAQLSKMLLGISEFGPKPVAHLRLITLDKEDPLSKIHACLDDLCRLGESWNRTDMDAPNPVSINKAKHWVASMRRDAINCRCVWVPPHVSTNENGDVTFEWWNGRRKLTVYVEPEHAWYIKSWGADIHSEMSDGTAESLEERQDIWSWLTNC